jgi:membrane peptidoglycan carboxypeptidase
MRIRPDSARIPTIRRALIRLHTDLFAIDKRAPWWISSEPLSPVEKMILILEDRRFFFHSGFDLRSGLRELLRAITVQPHGGASTIDMQLVRTATGFREKTMRRKAYEILLAMLIQYRYNKLQILRIYLGCAFFGSHLLGIQKISRRIYGKEPSDLSIDEAAEVAAMLVYPRPLLPTPEWWAKLTRRANYARALYPRLEKSFDKLPSWKMF